MLSTRGQRIREGHFILGVVCALGFSMGFQDWYGLEGYLEYVQTHWTELPWWLGALVATTCYLTNRWLVYRQGRDDRRREKAHAENYPVH